MALASDCISRTDLRALATATLAGADTLAGSKVYDADTLPFTMNDFPVLIVSAPSERKETTGDGAPQFNTTIMLALMARVQDRTEGGAERALDLLVRQAEQAILCTPSMVAPVQRFNFLETHSVINNAGETFVGEATMIFGCMVWQIYEPDAGEPLTDIVVSTAKPPGQGPTFKSFLSP